MGPRVNKADKDLENDNLRGASEVRRRGTKIDRSGRPGEAIDAVDLFCGAGGLTHGLLKAGIRVWAGIDVDGQAEYAYQTNNHGAAFYRWDLSRKRVKSIENLFGGGGVRLLAGCAPCQPFSKLTNGNGNHEAWDLLDYFGGFVCGMLPELVTMENVPELAERGKDVFQRFLKTLKKCDYRVDWRIVNCAEYGVPQSRHRLVLIASRLGEIAIPRGPHRYPSQWKTVRQAVKRLRALKAGEEDPNDPLHAAVRLSPLNLRRVKATEHDGGNRRSWPTELVLKCHRKESGKSYGSIYGRMWWDKPAPTMTTLCTGLGNGRFGHPEQDRSITLREAAVFQGFPRSYEFWPKEEVLNRKAVGRMIGNAVPPKLAMAIGKAIVDHVRQMK